MTNEAQQHILPMKQADQSTIHLLANPTGRFGSALRGCWATLVTLSKQPL
jgi:hypothetical protein